MRFIGKIHSKRKGEKYHSVEINELGIFTQGTDYEDCLEMAHDSLETLLNIKINIAAHSLTTFTVSSDDLKPLIGRFLSTMRENADLTIREVVERLGKKSPNYYAQYEQGKSLPGLDTLSDLIKAMSPEQDLFVSLKRID